MQCWLFLHSEKQLFCFFRECHEFRVWEQFFLANEQWKLDTATEYRIFLLLSCLAWLSRWWPLGHIVGEFISRVKLPLAFFSSFAFMFVASKQRAEHLNVTKRRCESSRRWRRWKIWLLANDDTIFSLLKFILTLDVLEIRLEGVMMSWRVYIYSCHDCSWALVIHPCA